MFLVIVGRKLFCERNTLATRMLNDLKARGSLEAHRNGEPGSKMVESLPFGCNDRTSDNLVVCFPFFFILIVDIPDIHGGEGYEDEIDGGYHCDLTDNHEIQLLLKTSTKNNVPAIGRPAFRTISQKYK